MVSGRSLVVWTCTLAAIVLTASVTPVPAATAIGVRPTYFTANRIAPPFDECPAVGADKSCGILLIINQDGTVTVIPDTSQPTFDGVGGDDTLVGVLNLSSFTVPSLTLTSNAGAFGFDGDGICSITPRAPGCPFPTTSNGYEGPDNTFTVVDANHGSVNFRNGGLPPGRSTFFGLEAALTQASFTFPTQLTYVGATTGDFDDPVTLAARLTAADNGPPIANQPVQIKLGDEATCLTRTDANGIGQCVISPPQPAGVVPITASFAGAGILLPSTTTANFTVTPEESALFYVGDNQLANGTPAILAAELTEDGVTPVAGRVVVLTLGSTPQTEQTCSALTAANGVATCTIPSVEQPLNADARVDVSARFGGDGFYQPATASTSLPLEFLTGRAFDFSTHIDLPPPLVRDVPPGPDTGAVRTADAGTLTPPCATNGGALAAINADALCANVTTALAPGTSTATATLDHISIAIPELPVVLATTVRTTSTTTCTASGGTTTIANLTVGGQQVTSGLGPNTTIALSPTVRLVVNEQLPVAGADNGRTVNALHVIGSDGRIDVVVGSVTTDIHNCPNVFTAGPGAR